MQGVCRELERCRTPDDQELVEGLINKKAFAKLPDDFTKAEHEKTLRAGGLCRVRCTKRLTEGELENLGISMGDGMMILDVLQTNEEPEPALGAAGEVRSATKPRRPEMLPFPKCGMAHDDDNTFIWILKTTKHS